MTSFATVSLKERLIYSSNFEVSANVSQYRATTHPFKITITPRTHVAEKIAIVPSYSYSFFPLAEIEKLNNEKHNIEYLIDVLAFVKSIGTLEEYRRDNETKNKLRMRNQCRMYIFDECASDAFMSQLQNTQTPVVVLLNLARGETFVIRCIIQKLETRYGWIYQGCSKCGTKLRLENESWICPSCQKKPEFIDHKMKLHYTVKDETGIASIIFWDKLAVELIKNSAAELKVILDEDPEEVDFPKNLDNPVGKIFTTCCGTKSGTYECYSRSSSNCGKDLVSQCVAEEDVTLSNMVNRVKAPPVKGRKRSVVRKNVEDAIAEGTNTGSSSSNEQKHVKTIKLEK
ncbi:uncharacterized protein LOC114754740 [Neltuma alba]|uniref:uncharacterized protein LOC114754740 n=1 Tax=Neltuma alba TaxID=207710 RepID=UPI0010A35129|nr:uncharacterized protein LOC114754740 [Prosopis alba]